jgi:hypothetical protein
VTILSSLLKEIVSMFLADGRLPIWLILWIAVIGILAHAGAAAVWSGALLLGGIVVILAANVLATARAARPRATVRGG